jgi:hypothetical protein
MIGNKVRKLFIAVILIIPVFVSADCKKQVRCGCGKDVLLTLTSASAYIYWSSSAIITFQTVGDPYSTYYFCNPSQMFPKLAESKSGDLLQVSGAVYWDCNFVYQSSNSSYQSSYKVYEVQVTDLSVDLYGKNKPAPQNPSNSVQ